MAKVVLKGLDYIGLNIVFDNQTGKDLFLRDAEKLNHLGLKTKADFLGEAFIKVAHRRNHKGRFELRSQRGLYLDFSCSKEIGSSFLLRAALLKPIDRSLPNLLWEGDSGYETMKDVLSRLEHRYGKISYSIAEVHLCCHFTGIKFKAADSNRFVGLPRGPWCHDKGGFSGFNFKHKRAKVKRVEASLYSIANRLDSLPNSFDPKAYYPAEVNPSQVYNLEFKVFKKTLNERQIYTLDDLKMNFTSLWYFLTTEKVRMVVKSKDSLKRRWDTNRHWRTIQNAFGKNFTELKRVRSISQREAPAQMIKKIQTMLTGLSASLDLSNIPLDERVKHVFGCFDISCFSDEEIFRYRYERGF